MVETRSFRKRQRDKATSPSAADEKSGEGRMMTRARKKLCSLVQPPIQIDSSSPKKGILSLPDELLEVILGKLSFEEIVKLRRVCKKFRKIFPALCTAPVVQYDTSKPSKIHGLHRLQKVVKSVTSSATHTLTIIEPTDCRFAINEAMIKDLKKRCPNLKRLILKGDLIHDPRAQHDRRFVHFKDNAVSQLPSSVVLELHDADMSSARNYYRSADLHGIYRGPFNNWTVDYVKSREADPSFRELLPTKGYMERFRSGELNLAADLYSDDSDDESDTDSDASSDWGGPGYVYLAEVDWDNEAGEDDDE